MEDDHFVASLISHYLSEEPYDFQHSDTGNKALSVLDEKNPAVMILDLKLPDINGIDILKKIYTD
ncbi:MAG: DNA-binding response OmpR family regulator [Enterobacterales bacterium]